MKLIFLAWASLLSLNSQAFECDHSVDSSKVILFIYTNPTYKELVTAQKAACELNQKLVAVPTVKISLLKEFEDIIENGYYINAWEDEVKSKIDDLKIQIVKLKNPSNSNQIEINKLETQIATLNQKLDKISDKREAAENAYYDVLDKFLELKNNEFKPFQTHINQSIEKLLTIFDRTNIKVTTVILSGHSGNSVFDGDFGRISLSELNGLTLTHDSLKDFETLILLGCNTAGPSQSSEIIKNLPNLKFLAGYADSAPLSMFEHNTNYLYEMLIHSEEFKQIKSISELKKLQKSLRSLDPIYEGGAVIFGEQHILFYDSESTNEQYQKGIRAQMSDCSNYHQQITTLSEYLEKYFTGSNKEYEPSKNASEGVMKQLYVVLRLNEKCYTEYAKNAYSVHIKNGNQAGLLRFWTNVKLNFAQTFSKEYDDFFSSIESLNRKFFQYNHKISKIPTKDLLVKLSRYEVFEENEVKFEIFIINKNLINIAGANASTSPTYNETNLEIEKIRKFLKLWDQYIVQLDDKCMDFMTWHEFRKGKIVPGQCQ